MSSDDEDPTVHNQRAHISLLAPSMSVPSRDSDYITVYRYYILSFYINRLDNSSSHNNSYTIN